MKKSDYSRSRPFFDRAALAGGLSAAAIAMMPGPVDGSTVVTTSFAVVGHQNSTSYLIDDPLPHKDRGFAISLQPDLDGWTDADRKRFRELALEEAVGELAQEERAELEQLTRLRRRFEHPRSGDEILWEFEQRRRTKDLLKTLRRYVEFYEGPSPAWTAAGKDIN